MQPLIELTDNLNWNLAARYDLTAQVNSDGNIIEPIGRQVIMVPSTTFLFACRNGNARSYWWLGCWISFCSPNINPGATATIDTDVELGRGKVGLNRTTLFRFPDFGIPNYLIYVTIPHWHSAMLLEVWWYDSDRSDPLTELVKDVGADVLRVETKVDSLI